MKICTHHTYLFVCLKRSLVTSITVHFQEQSSSSLVGKFVPLTRNVEDVMNMHQMLNQSTTAKNGTSANFDKNAKLICYRLSRAKRRPIKMVSISEGPSNQDIFIAERLVPRSRAQFNFICGSEILLEKNSQQLSLLTFTLRCQKDQFLSRIKANSAAAPRTRFTRPSKVKTK